MEAPTLTGKTILACQCCRCRRLVTVATDEELRKGERGVYVCPLCQRRDERREFPPRSS